MRVDGNAHRGVSTGTRRVHQAAAKLSPQPRWRNRRRWRSRTSGRSVLRFPGQYYDAETGLNYNYYRDYDPATGRYVESDPDGLYGGLNTYAYVRSSPLGTTDPKGLFGTGGSTGQAWDTFWKTNSVCLTIAVSAQQEAFRQAEATGLPGRHNGAQDAFRHCEWSCIMAKLGGPACAKAVGEIHEAAGNSQGQSADESNMDNYNNGQGRDAGCAPGEKCHDTCRKKLQNCELHGLDGKPLCFPPK